MATLLKDVRPDLASQLVDQTLLPTLCVGSSKKVEWRCEKGHRWFATPAHRKRTERAFCPVCLGQRVLVGFNDLATTDPEAASLCANPSDARRYTRSSNAKISWRCSLGHTWKATVASVTKGDRCPYCSGHRVLAGFNDLATTHPVLASQLVDEGLATRVSAGSNRKVAWKCSLGHRWEARVSDRVGGQGCPYCSGHRVLVGFNDLATTHPALASQLVDQSLATRLTAGSNRKVAWECSHGHCWSALVSSRALGGNGCPYCAGKRPGADYNLARALPEVAAMLADPSLGERLTPKSSQVVEWVCPNDPSHHWEASVYNVAKGRRCPICRGLVVKRGVNDLWTTHPEVARELVNPDEGYEVSAGSRQVLSWQCSSHSDHVWEASVLNRVLGHTGCPICTNRMVKVGYNDLATTHPDLARRLVHPEDALSVTYGSNRELEWHCDKGHTWVDKVSVEGRYDFPNCPECGGAHRSTAEKELVRVVEGLVGSEVEVLRNVRPSFMDGRELDIFIPEKLFAVDFNGVFWHSDGAGADRLRSLRKFELCQAAGVRLVQVWEDDWRDRRSVCVEMLAAKLGCLESLPRVLSDVDPKALSSVGARKCSLVEVSRVEAASFLEVRHIQGAGSLAGCSSFGLRDSDGDLRALLCVRSPSAGARLRRRVGEWDIVRYVTLGRVPGGFSRLLAFAERRLRASGEEVRLWVTFSANDVSAGDLYAKTGFSRDRELAPDYRYVGQVTGWRRLSKEAFQKRRFREDPSLLWDEAWSEREAARANGLWRIYDAGKVRWVKAVD